MLVNAVSMAQRWGW